MMKAIWIALLAGFSAVNVYALEMGSWTGSMDYLGSLGLWGTLAIVDLLIALFIAVVFIVRDAAAKKINPLPYVILTLLTGSLGMLIYLVRFWKPVAPTNRPTILAEN
jgi:hypothetical protein